MPTKWGGGGGRLDSMALDGMALVINKMKVLQRVRMVESPVPVPI